MQNKLFKTNTTISLIATLFLLFFVAISANSVWATESHGLDETANKAFDGNIPNEGENPASIAGNVVGAGLQFIGGLFFILIIYGGLLWMTARGNEQQVEKAKNLIITAVIGLVIVLSAYAITSFIGTSLTN